MRSKLAGAVHCGGRGPSDYLHQERHDDVTNVCVTMDPNSKYKICMNLQSQKTSSSVLWDKMTDNVVMESSFFLGGGFRYAQGDLTGSHTWRPSNTSKLRTEWAEGRSHMDVKTMTPQCLVSLKKGQKKHVEFSRPDRNFQGSTSLYAADMDFIKLTACVNILWKFKNNSVVQKGQECSVSKQFKLSNYKYKFPESKWEAWNTSEAWSVWSLSLLQATASAIL